MKYNLLKNTSNFKILNINGIELLFEIFKEDNIIYNCSIYHVHKKKMVTLLDLDAKNLTAKELLKKCFLYANKIRDCDFCSDVYVKEKYLKDNLCKKCTWQEEYNKINKDKCIYCYICCESKLKSMTKICHICKNITCDHCIDKMKMCAYCMSFDSFYSDI